MKKDPNSELRTILTELKQVLHRYLKQEILDMDSSKPDKVLIQEEQEVIKIIL